MVDSKNLLDRLKAGDESAFKEVVKANQTRVYNVCLSILHDPEDAEDVSQEVFIHFYQKIGQFRAASELTTWLYRITVNKCLELLRSRKRKKRWALITSLWKESGEVVDVAGFDHPGISLENKERAKILFSKIDLLPDQQKIAFTLHKIEEQSYVEIAVVMGTTVSAVESLIHRARQNLKKTLHTYYEKDLI